MNILKMKLKSEKLNELIKAGLIKPYSTRLALRVKGACKAQKLDFKFNEFYKVLDND